MSRFPSAYLEYLVFFNRNRDFFECHEVLEAYWKEVPESPFRQTWVGLIQVAVSLYHQRRGNQGGARKMLRSAISLLNREKLERLGMDSALFLERLQERMDQLEKQPHAEYEDIDIPLSDQELIRQYEKQAATMGYQPGEWKAQPGADIINKHTRRDRSDVIQERLRQLEIRRLRKEGTR